MKQIACFWNSIGKKAVARVLIALCSMVMPVGFAAAQTHVPFPGTVVFKSPDPVKKRVASPAILILPGGDYLVSHDYDKGTAIHISKDRGRTWAPLSRVSPLIWANLFEHRGAVYLMGTAKGWGDMVVYRSLDNGRTWSVPKDENSGLLARGMFHTGPVPVVKHNGKIWRAYEEAFDKNNRRDFFAFAICADEDADLLKASSWKRTNSIRFDESWLNAKRPNWFEGNIVVTPQGQLADFMRLETWTGKDGSYAVKGAAAGKPRNEIAAIIRIDGNSGKMEFNNEPASFIHFPGAESKFTIRYDSVSGSYWAITNKITSFIHSTETFDGNWNQRNVLVLLHSKDLRNWEIKRVLLRWNEGAHLRTWDTFGFQYVDWQFDGNDIVWVSRTSWYGLRYHDANMITFDRISNFRSRPPGNGPEDLLKYTQHPVLLTLTAAVITKGSWEQNSLNVKITCGDGMRSSGMGQFKFTGAPEPARNEKEATAAGRYFDINIQAGKGKTFSLETLQCMPTANRKDIKLRWMYSTDNGATFDPVTNYSFPVPVQRQGYMKADPPVYLQVYKPLNKIKGRRGVMLRCYIIGGNKTGTVLEFADHIALGGRIL